MRSFWHRNNGKNENTEKTGREGANKAENALRETDAATDRREAAHHHASNERDAMMEHGTPAKLFDIWLSLRVGPASGVYRVLRERFPSSYRVYQANSEEIGRLPVSDHVKTALADKEIADAYEILTTCQRDGISVLTCGEAPYPAALASIPDAPYVLYVLGDCENLGGGLQIAIVGTRACTGYGAGMAYSIARDLAQAGATVVSGLALGIDGAAALGALVGGGKTVGVLGCGIDEIYPPAHFELFRQMISRGNTIVSEYPPKTKAKPYFFPQRNRIISGLCDATLVVEAAPGSGALISAQKALLYGRELYAVPGKVGDKNATGTNGLLHEGATMALSAADILESFAEKYGLTVPLSIQKSSQIGFDLSQVDLNELKRCGLTPREFGWAIRTEERPLESAGRSPSKNGVAPTKDPVREYSRQKLGDQQDDGGTGSPSQTPESNPQDFSENEKKVLSEMPTGEAVSPETITRCGLKMSEITATLTVLEIKGAVASMPGGLYLKL